MQRIILVTTADDLAADLVVLHLKRRNGHFVRFNQEDFPARAQLRWHAPELSAAIALNGEVVDCADIRSAWFRYPVGPSLFSWNQGDVDFLIGESAAFLCGFWETMPWFWMNRPSAAALASSKLRQIAHAREVGLRVPRTLITNCPEAARGFVSGRSSIAKTVANAAFSRSGEAYAVYTSPVVVGDLSDAAVAAAPIIFQQRVTNDFDLRATVVGSQVFAARIVVDGRDNEPDWRALDVSRVTYERYDLPADIRRSCIALTKAFSLSFAALDFIVTPGGDHVFLEINPSGQWGWLEQETDLPITEAIVDQLMEGTL